MQSDDLEIYRTDPYPEIEASLLNSMHIACYAEKECLVSNFDGKRLKPASYEMQFLGELHYWDSAQDYRNTKKKIIVSEGKEVTLPRNSITYLLLAEAFRLPHYIAARFNLSIRNVHKGLLLGTGPLVDPGFQGRLLIPLHNLTDQDHVLTGGESLIWVEFTKVSSLKYRSKKGEEKPKNLVEFPKEKNLRSAQEYFQKAGVWTSGVVGAFKGELDKAVTSAEKAEEAVSGIRWAGILAVSGLIATLIIGVGPLVTTAFEAKHEAQRLLVEAKEALEQMKKERRDFHDKMSALVSKTGALDDTARRQHALPQNVQSGDKKPRNE